MPARGDRSSLGPHQFLYPSRYGPKRTSFSSPYRLHVVLFSGLVLMTGGIRADCVGYECVVIGGWENFANNIGTDLAPLLALFGEQVTKQFMSESLSIADSILFSLAPLGIITAIVAAIRVAGSPKLRALIGRAKESRGSVEADLMSSTSSDVCELWNGEGVVRVLGRPVLLQLVWVDLEEINAAKQPGQLLPEDSAGLFTFQEAIGHGFYEEKHAQDNGSNTEVLRNHRDPPNLSLNVSMKALPRWVSIIYICIGLILQIGVLVFAAATQYILATPSDAVTTITYGFPVMVTGTVCLAIGMFVCAHIVERSTEEHTWAPVPRRTQVIWLQQGGQTVGDQRFESFARRTENNVIITSSKCGENNMTSMVLIGVSFALLGFIAQFLALRAMYATVIVAQLGAVLIMTAIRACAHIQRESKNDIENPDQVEGHELDWLAKRFHSCQAWEVISGPNSKDNFIPSATERHSLLRGSITGGSHQNPTLFHRRIFSQLSTMICGNFWRKQKLLMEPETTTTEKDMPNIAMTILKTRARLAHLSKDWVIELRETVQKLRNTLDATMNEVFSIMVLKDDWKGREEFSWTLPIMVQLNDKSTKLLTVNLSMHRSRDENGQWTPWKSNECELESVLCLWVSSLAETNRVREEEGLEPVQNFWYLGMASDTAIDEYRMWIHRMTTPQLLSLQDDARYFGFVEGVFDVGSVPPNNPKYLCIPTGTSIHLICAHQIYTGFMASLARIVGKIGGTTERRISEPTEDESNQKIPSWMYFRLSNSNLASLATIFFEHGLGTIEDAYFSIFPSFRATGMMPSSQEVFREARKASRICELGKKWDEALEIDAWLCKNRDLAGFSAKETLVLFTEGEERLLRFTAYVERMEVQTDPSFGKFLDHIWDAICMRSQNSPGCSLVLASCLVWLCRLGDRFLSRSPDFFDVGSKVLQGADFHQGHLLDLVMEFAHTALENGNAREAEILSIHVWNATHPPPSDDEHKDRQIINRNFRATQVLLETRQKRGVFMILDDFKRYLEDQNTYDQTPGPTKLSTDDIKHVSMALDLHLFLPYRTELQAAAEAGRLDLVQPLLDKWEKYLRLNQNDKLGDDENPLSYVEDMAVGYHRLTAVQAAAGKGHLEVVQILLDHKRSEMQSDPKFMWGRSALQAAATCGHLDVATLLLHNGSPVDDILPIISVLVNEFFYWCEFEGLLELGGPISENDRLLALRKSEVQLPALQSAAANGHLKMVELLLAAGAQVDGCIQEDYGSSALQVAAAAGHEDVVRLLLSKNAEVNLKASNYGGRTALQAAAGAGQLMIVRLLLKHKADPNAAPGTYFGRTALQAAVEANYKKIVELLLSVGADIDAAGSEYYGYTALQVAARRGHIDMVELLLSATAHVNSQPSPYGGLTAFQAAAASGHIEIAVMLLKVRAHVNESPAENGGRTALQAAAQNGHIEVVQFLLQERAHINAVPAESYGRTALQGAAGNGHTKIVEMLLQEGADINAAPGETDGVTALQAAARSGDVKMVELLLKEGTEVDGGVVDSYGELTALQEASKNGHIDVVNLLLGAGADVNGPTAQYAGRTALQAAASNGHLEIMKLLLLENAEVNPEVGRGGMTVLQCAAMGGHTEAVNLLLKADASIDAPPPEPKPAHKETPEALARKSNHTEIVDMLVLAASRRKTSSGTVAGATPTDTTSQNPPVSAMSEGETPSISDASAGETASVAEISEGETASVSETSGGDTTG